MRTPSEPQSYLRYPLNRILASEGAVRVIRELARHGGEQSVAGLAGATRLSKGAVRHLLQADLLMAGIVESVGTGRNVLYRLNRGHPLHAPLHRLFEEEEAHARHLLDVLAAAARDAAPNVLALWLYGSVARGDDAPGSDLDVAIVLTDADPAPAVARYRARLAPLREVEPGGISVVGLSADDVARLSAADDPWWRNVVTDGLALLGPPPGVLAQRLRMADDRASPS